MRYEVRAEKDFGYGRRGGILCVYDNAFDEEEMLIEMIQTLLKFPAPMLIHIETFNDPSSEQSEEKRQ